MLIVQRFGVRIFGAFLPLPFFPFAIAAAAAACATTGGAARGRGDCLGWLLSCRSYLGSLLCESDCSEQRTDHAYRSR